LVWSEQLDLPLGVIGKLGWPLVKPAFLLGLRHSLQKFAQFAARYDSI